MESLLLSPSCSPSSPSAKLRSFSVFADVMNAKKFILKLESSLKRDKKTDLQNLTESVRKKLLKNRQTFFYLFSNSFLCY